MHFVLQDGHSVRNLGWPEYPVSFRFGDQIPTLRETSAPGLVDIEVNDSGRSLSADTQNMTFTFTEAVNTSALGWSITVNGVAKTLTYVSGTGTAVAVFRVNVALHDNDVAKVSYDPTTGATTSVTGALQIKKIVGYVVEETLSRRIRFTLCDKNDAAVASEAVKAAVLEYHGAVVADEITQGPRPNWMTRANAATVTTDSSGVFDMEYTGFVRGGGNVYVVIFRGNGENLSVAATVT